MEIALSIIGLVISIAIAIWEHRRASAAERRLDELMKEMPNRVVAAVGVIGRSVGGTTSGVATTVHDEPGASGAGFYVRTADLNGDGRLELLVEFPVGMHGTALHVFGLRDEEFTLLADMSTGCPVGFDIEDVDGDGRLEVVTRDTDWTLDLPYVCGLREKIAYRLELTGFVEVSRVKDYTDAQLEMARANYST